MNQPFQATRVASRTTVPTKPVTLSLSEDAIGNMLILSPPKELRKAEGEMKVGKGPLDFDFLKFNGLDNALDIQAAMIFQDKLSMNFLDNQFLANILDQIANGLDENLLAPVDSLLPDYKKASGIIAIKDEMTVGLCRDNGADRQCVTVPNTQNSTIFQQQGNLEFKNRVNNGGNTFITLIQK